MKKYIFFVYKSMTKHKKGEAFMGKMKSIGKKLTMMSLAVMLLALLAFASLASQSQLADEPHGCSACEERLSASQIGGDASAIPEVSVASGPESDATYSNEPPTDSASLASSPTAHRSSAPVRGRHIIIRVKLPGRATLLSPSGTIGTSNPTFLWRCVPGATQYLLRVLNVNTNTVILNQWYNAEDVVSSQGCSINPGLSLINGNSYRWWIQAKNSKGTGPLSYFNSFRYANVSPGSVTPISPRGLISTMRPTFIWTATSSATQYRLQVKNSTDVIVIDETFLAEDVTSGARAIALSPTILLGGIYFWRVQASNNAGVGPWSGDRYFEIVCGVWQGQAGEQMGVRSDRESRSVTRQPRPQIPLRR